MLPNFRSGNGRLGFREHWHSIFRIAPNFLMLLLWPTISRSSVRFRHQSKITSCLRIPTEDMSAELPTKYMCTAVYSGVHFNKPLDGRIPNEPLVSGAHDQGR
ncbi:hypothetical protein PTI98_005826 [Pleurotus ostreatus]|nr:hypothetical protein PTI98_005826 [Pleurotus ostreatus]